MGNCRSAGLFGRGSAAGAADSPGFRRRPLPTWPEGRALGSPGQPGGSDSASGPLSHRERHDPPRQCRGGEFPGLQWSAPCSRTSRRSWPGPRPEVLGSFANSLELFDMIRIENLLLSLAGNPLLSIMTRSLGLANLREPGGEDKLAETSRQSSPSTIASCGPSRRATPKQPAFWRAPREGSSSRRSSTGSSPAEAPVTPGIHAPS